MANPAVRLRRITLLVLLILAISLLGVLAYTRLPQLSGVEAAAAEVAPTENLTETAAAVLTDLPQQAISDPNGSLVILSMIDEQYAHLFAFHPVELRFYRLTNSPWDDIHPAVSPDGTQLAFSSRQNGYWDLYVWNFVSGDVKRVTDSPEYDGSPSWSPDGQWLAYESYVDENLEIFVRNLSDLNQAPIRLTEDPATDSSPAWSPGGREIAFVSNRAGDEDIWLAGLDRVDDRFINLSAGTGGQEIHPDWSLEGRYLAWSSNQQGSPEIYIWEAEQPKRPPRMIAAGTQPTWDPSGTMVLSDASGANNYALAAYDLTDSHLTIPYTPIPSRIDGIDWLDVEASHLLARFLSQTPLLDPSQHYQPSISTVFPSGRFRVIPLADVSAPYPYLHDAVDEAFMVLREAAGKSTGWDVLSSLENAYLPITEPSGPGVSEEWLFTGRAFALNPLPIQAGWMAVIREEYSGQTYWRIYLKTRFQDGSAGRPLSGSIWNLDARSSGDPRAYEQGGAYAPALSGYWIDFTEFAARYGWQRPAALRSWRTFYPATRFNQFYFPENLDWIGAMDQLYPPEALHPPTAIPTLTLTPFPTNTPRPIGSATIAPTPTITATTTQRPTWTPLAVTPTP